MQGDVQRFLERYFGGDGETLQQALPAIRLLAQLTRYQSCVRSLFWLNELGPVQAGRRPRRARHES